jgi:DNA-binding response OmpR family regulator
MVLTVLLVESDTKLAAVYREFLGKEGYKVVTAADAQQAIHAVDEHRPNLVVLEVQLPDHNGVEFLYELRSYADWHDLPVIIYSIIPPERFKIAPENWGDYGVQDYLYKPKAKLTDLLKAINKILQP